MIRRSLFLAAALLGGFLLPAEAQQVNTSGASSGVTSANVQNQVASCAADTGAADVYVVTLSPAPAAYASLQRFCFKAVNANATTTPTLNVNGLGAKTITKNGGAALAANDIKAGQVVDVEYDGTNLQMQSTLGNAASGGSVSVNGSTVSSPNLASTTAYDSLASNKFIVSGSNIAARTSYPFNNNCAMFGDSTDTDATPTSGAIVPTWANGFHYGYAGMLFTNECTGWQGTQALSGDMAADMALKLYAQLGSTWMQSSTGLGLQRPAWITMKIGVNDANLKTNSTYQTTVFRPTIYAAVLAAAIPTAGQTYGQNAACTATGTWTNDNAILSGMGKVSNTNGDTLSCTGIVTTAASPWIYPVYKAIDSNGGTFTVKIDGATCTDSVTGVSTIAAVGGAAISTTNGATTSPFAARCAAAAGTHTVLYTVTSATNAANKVAIQFTGAMPAIAGNRDNIPRVLMAGVLPQKLDANSTWTRPYDKEVAEIVGRLIGDGIPVIFVPVHTYTVALLDATAPVANETMDINDGTSATDCTVGGGSTMVRCVYSGSAWTALTGITPVNIPTTAGLWTDTFHPADAVHHAIHEQFASLMSTPSSSQFMMNLGFIQSGSTAFTSAPLVCLGNANGELALGDCRGYGNVNVNFDMRSGVLRHYTDDLYANNGNTTDIDQQRGRNFFLMAGCSGCRIGWTNSTTQGTASEDTTMDRAAAGVVGVSTTSAGNHDGVFSAKGFISPNVVHQTAKTAAITTSTLCAAATGGCNVAGQYHISATIINTGTACTNITAGSVGLNLTWTDSNGTTHTTVTVPLFTQASSTATAATMPFVANNLSAFASADFNISTNGTIVQYATTYTACTTGTGTYQLDISINKVQ